jgi:FkbM family methyltransferase
VGEIDDFYLEVMRDLGVELVPIDPVNGERPLDLVRILEAAPIDCDVLLALRSDIAIAGDISAWLTLDAAMGRLASDGTIAPCLLAVPGARAREVAAHARSIEPELRAWRQAERVPELALSMAVSRLELPFIAAPAEIAFPLHGDRSQIASAHDVAPLLLVHGHVLLPSGELRPCGLATPDGIVERVNVELRPDGAPAGAPPPRPAVHPYFPTRGATVITVEAEFRRHVEQLGEAARHHAYTAFSHQHPDLVSTSFRGEGEQVVARQLDRDITYPAPLPLIKYSHISFGYEEWLEHKYSLPEFVVVEPGDVVVDCGAFVGGFSLSAARIADQVHLFEPEPANVACIERNFAGVDTVTVNQMGLFTTTGTEWLNVSESGVEHSMLQPDDGDAVDRISIEVTRLDDYCERRGLDGIDFLKVEAEGVELEVLQGLGEVRPRRIAVDVSPERDGTSPARQITALLEGWGYETRRRVNVLFARRGGDA